MEYLEVRNLDKYQDRRATRWIKVHKNVLNDYKLTKLTQAQKWTFIGLIILGVDNENRIPNDPEWIGQILGAESSEDQYGLGPLLRNGLVRVVDDSEGSNPKVKPSQSDKSKTAEGAVSNSNPPAKSASQTFSDRSHKPRILQEPSSGEDERPRKKERKKERQSEPPTFVGRWVGDFDLRSWIDTVAEAHPKGSVDTFCERALSRLTQPPPNAEEVCRCIRILEETPEWKQADGRYIAGFEKFIASRGWEMAYRQAEPIKRPKIVDADEFRQEQERLRNGL